MTEWSKASNCFERKIETIPVQQHTQPLIGDNVTTRIADGGKRRGEKEAWEGKVTWHDETVERWEMMNTWWRISELILFISLFQVSWSSKRFFVIVGGWQLTRANKRVLLIHFPLSYFRLQCKTHTLCVLSPAKSSFHAYLWHVRRDISLRQSFSMSKFIVCEKGEREEQRRTISVIAYVTMRLISIMIITIMIMMTITSLVRL